MVKIVFHTTRRTEKEFATPWDAVEELDRRGYTHASGGGRYEISTATRLYKNTHSGAYARPHSDTDDWSAIVHAVADVTTLPL